MLGRMMAGLLGPQPPMDLGVKAGPGWAGDSPCRPEVLVCQSPPRPLQAQSVLGHLPKQRVPRGRVWPQGEPQERLGHAPGPSVLPLMPGVWNVSLHQQWDTVWATHTGTGSHLSPPNGCPAHRSDRGGGLPGWGTAAKRQILAPISESFPDAPQSRSFGFFDLTGISGAKPQGVKPYLPFPKKRHT